MELDGIGAGIFYWLIYIGGFLIVLRMMLRSLIIGSRKILGME